MGNKVVISGYYGYGNIGDEAILESMIYDLRNFLNPEDIIILSNNPDSTLKYGIKSYSSRSITGNIKSLYKADLFISGGGGLTNDWETFSFLVYSFRVLLASIICKKSMIYAQGIGPLHSKINRNITKFILNQVDLITVRDEESKDLLKNIGVKKQIYVTSDPVFTLKPADEKKIKKILESNNIKSGEKLIIITIRSLLEKEGAFKFKETIAAFVDYLIDRNFKVIFMPFQPDHDKEILDETINLVKNKDRIKTIEGYSPRETIGIIKKADMVIGMRLHSLIFATITGTPLIGLIYDTKVKNFLNIVNQLNNAIYIQDIELSKLVDIFERLEEDKIKTGCIQDKVLELRNKALINVELTKKLLKVE